MIIDRNLLISVITPIIAGICGFFIRPLFEKKPKLIAYFGHIAAFNSTLPDNRKLHIHTHSVIIRNNGALPANNIKIRHAYLPDFKIYPPVEYSIIDLENNYKEILIPKLISKEQLTISYLYFPPIIASQIHEGIKSDEGFAKVLNVLPTPQLPKWQLRIVQTLFLIGVVATIYFVLIAIKAGLSWCF